MKKTPFMDLLCRSKLHKNAFLTLLLLSMHAQAFDGDQLSLFRFLLLYTLWHIFIVNFPGLELFWQDLKTNKQTKQQQKTHKNKTEKNPYMCYLFSKASFKVSHYNHCICHHLPWTWYCFFFFFWSRVKIKIK